jgi:hypothetical protein
MAQGAVHREQDAGCRVLVQRTGCKVQSKRHRGQIVGAENQVQGTWCGVQGAGCRAQGAVHRMRDTGSRMHTVQGAGCGEQGDPRESVGADLERGRRPEILESRLVQISRGAWRPEILESRPVPTRG